MQAVPYAAAMFAAMAKSWNEVQVWQQQHMLCVLPISRLTWPMCDAAAMYAAMAAPGDKDDQPKATSNGIIGFLFYAAFIVICAFCLLNLYVGVIFSEFSKIRLLSTAGSAFLTAKQQVGISWAHAFSMYVKTISCQARILPLSDCSMLIIHRQKAASKHILSSIHIK
jgi:hypothetical protein